MNQRLVDPSNRKSIWEYLERLNKEEGTTIFLTTQYLEEADVLADRISIIDGGKIVATGTPEELKARIGNDLITLSFSNGDEAANAKEKLQTHLGEIDIVERGSDLVLYVENGTKRLIELVRVLDQEHVEVQSINVDSPTLDDIFLKITGEGIKDDMKGEKQHG